MVSRHLIVYVLSLHFSVVFPKYATTWRSLDARPLPSWYNDGKFGIFIHWGVYSVPSFDSSSSEWFWKHWKDEHWLPVYYMRYNYPPEVKYSRVAKDLKAEYFNPNDWADLFKSSGARYVVLTSKHHEGFTLWPSSYSPKWNSVKLGPHRDLVGDLAKAVRSTTDLKFGLYYSLYEWFHPLYVADKKRNYTVKNYVKQKMMPEIIEMVNKYEPAIVWSDGEWEASEEYWNSKKFLAWLYNASPVRDYVVVNDRWGSQTRCRHGGFFTCADNFEPETVMHHKWERCSSIDKKSWGYRRNARLVDYLTTREIIQQLVSSVSLNGNLLLNIGPTKEGLIPLIMQERLLSVGSWLQLNGEAIYSTDPWEFQKDSTAVDVWFTKGREPGVIYAIVLQWPEKGALILTTPEMGSQSEITLLGYNRTLTWGMAPEGVEISLPNKKSLTWDIFSLKLTDIMSWRRE